MLEAERGEFRVLLSRLGAIHQRVLELDLLDSYFDSLKSVPMSAMRLAFKAATSECQFFPKPVELREMAVMPERPQNYDEQTYACLKCYDRAVVVTDRFDRNGQSLGRFGAPCGCAAGEAKRLAWQKTDAKGHNFADSAMDNTEKLRRKGAV